MINWRRGLKSARFRQGRVFQSKHGFFYVRYCAQFKNEIITSVSNNFLVVNIVSIRSKKKTGPWLEDVNIKLLMELSKIVMK